jgi:hypothetical protein
MGAWRGKDENLNPSAARRNSRVGLPLPISRIEEAVRRSRYVMLETIAPLSDDPIVSLPAMAA